MKKRLVVLLILMVSMAAIACGNGDANQEAAQVEGEEQQAAAGEGNTDQSMVIAVNADIISLDPHNVSDTLSRSAAGTMYEPLVEHNMEMEIIPSLAEDYWISEDGLEYTFALREGITFHDGTPFNAEAAKYNYDRIIDEEKNLRRRSNFLQLQSTEVVDEYTVKLVLEEPFAPMLDRVASLFMISPTALEEHGDDGIINNPSGTGPYVFKEWVPGDRLVVQRNENYWREGPEIRELTMRPVVENGARIAMLQTGEADFIYPMPTEQVNALSGEADIEIVQDDSTIVRFAFINTTKDEFSDPRVRQAMNYAIDKQAYASIVRSGYSIPLTSHVAETIQYHEAQEPYAYDVEKAKALLAEAGYPDGFSTDIWAPNDTENIRGMEFISQQLGEIGIDVEVIPMEEGTLSDSIYSAQTPEESTVNMWYVSWSAFDFDGATNRLFHSRNIPPASPNVSYYMNPAADQLIDEGAVEVDSAVRGQTYSQLQAMIWQDAPWIFLGSDVLLSAKRTTTEGIYVLPGGAINTTRAATTK